jgi:hypothetical protein
VPDMMGSINLKYSISLNLKKYGKINFKYAVSTMSCKLTGHLKQVGDILGAQGFVHRLLSKRLQNMVT